MTVCVSVRTEQLCCCTRRIFHKIWHFSKLYYIILYYIILYYIILYYIILYYIIHTVRLLHVSATLVSILRQVHYKRYARITKLFKLQHKCKVLSFKIYILVLIFSITLFKTWCHHHVESA